MTPTSASWAPASTAASSPEPRGDSPPGGLCAIHQPNLFPRLSTLAKLYAADHWIVLDDVQFARRDYQHRARLAALDDPDRQQWLTLPTHLPHGRSTLIRHARLADPRRSRRTTELLVRQYYGRSRHWTAIRAALEAVLRTIDTTDQAARIATASTTVLLAALGWQGQTVASSDLPARQGRSQRLADLAAATGSSHYLCGTGGMRYLDHRPFDAYGIPVIPFRMPTDAAAALCPSAQRATSLWALSTLGPQALAQHLVADLEAHAGATG
ncbi:WbqC family protein [Streptomyces sp. NPDC059378]|uniref:WbqC family protein n=1 Tax=Streptomyces sp. NPDC059378 TaxID=3346815 RepID=UPI003699988C